MITNGQIESVGIQDTLILTATPDSQEVWVFPTPELIAVYLVQVRGNLIWEVAPLSPEGLTSFQMNVGDELHAISPHGETKVILTWSHLPGTPI